MTQNRPARTDVRLYEILSEGGGAVLFEPKKPGTPDEQYKDGTTVNVLIPTLNDSVIGKIRRERQPDSTWRTFLVKEDGEVIEYRPEAGDKILGRKRYNVTSGD